jgi:hypothetical protein
VPRNVERTPRIKRTRRLLFRIHWKSGQNDTLEMHEDGGLVTRSRNLAGRCGKVKVSLCFAFRLAAHPPAHSTTALCERTLLRRILQSHVCSSRFRVQLFFRLKVEPLPHLRAGANLSSDVLWPQETTNWGFKRIGTDSGTLSIIFLVVVGEVGNRSPFQRGCPRTICTNHCKTSF